ncbi:M20 family metallo-hydrolase [Pseudactinotalea suaedae]|uniref:M20 family metallo-hydrolase n=1 Tax=Pseudactinotalea suaedae TaxID=1524924 RepID=UPI001F4F82B7|nr:M20 family metallo-hydrolase [Pseudactinotalea suaedae]
MTGEVSTTTGERGARVPTNEEDDARYLDDFAAVSTFGATPGGGVERLAGSAEDGAVRDWLVAWMRERDFSVVVDEIGNVFGLVELVPGAPYVAVGSHLDSQPLGGRYDGAYGVLAAAHAVDRIRRHALDGGDVTPRYNLAVVDWFNEEGARFAPSMMGSGVFTHKASVESALATADRAGATVEQALRQTGYRGSDAAPSLVGYAEIHVEQGRILEDAGITIGAVESTWAAHKYQVVVQGEQSHTGSTAMSDRRDALAGAARLIVAARELADAYAGPPALHTSVSELTVLPNSPVVVAREVRMNLDLRSPSAALLREAEGRFLAQVREVERTTAVEVSVRTTHQWDQQPYQSSGVELTQSIAAGLGLPCIPMQTIAGHDSTNLKDVVPTVMLFVPSVDGIAHNEGELTSDEDCLAGLRLLTEVVVAMAEGAVVDTE